MTTQHTPYDKALGYTTDPHHREILKAMKTGYHTAQADYAPLLAAAEALASVLRNFTMYNYEVTDNLVVLAQEAMQQYLAAIKQAKEGTA